MNASNDLPIFDARISGVDHAGLTIVYALAALRPFDIEQENLNKQTQESIMSKAETEYSAIADALVDGEEIIAGQMFGKRCLKVGGKAFVAQHLDNVVFKLGAPEHARALALPGAALWDPSGKGRPMKEWVAIPASAGGDFRKLAKAALEYVRSVS